MTIAECDGVHTTITEYKLRQVYVSVSHRTEYSRFNLPRPLDLATIRGSIFDRITDEALPRPPKNRRQK